MVLQLVVHMKKCCKLRLCGYWIVGFRKLHKFSDAAPLRKVWVEGVTDAVKQFDKLFV